MNEGASDLRVFVRELDPVVEAERKRQEDEKLAVRRIFYIYCASFQFK